MSLSSTILITTKDRKDELRTALKSCQLQQTSVPCEIFVINDGSSDGTGEMLANEFPSVRIVEHAESAGLVARRNEGTSAAIGDIVFSIDDDAEFTTPHVVEQTMKDFSDPRISAVAIPFCNVNQGDEVYQCEPGDGLLYVAHAFRGTAYAVRKSIFQELGGYRPYFIHQGEEGDLCCRMFAQGKYVRLGSSDVINHYESPRRDFTRMDVFGRRNDVLSTYLNTPQPYLPFHMAVTVVKGLVHGMRVGRVRNMVRGLWAGREACLEHRQDRAPISVESYKTYRHLKKCGPLALDDLSGVQCQSVVSIYRGWKMVDLAKFDNSAFDRGSSALKEFCWRLVQQCFFNLDWLRGYGLKRVLLKAFGARFDAGVVVKPRAKITFPWKLSIGANTWIGEESWLLNLDRIEIGANVCISQRSFLCTGSHDWAKDSFDLVTRPIVVEDGVWICANVFIGPGVTIGKNSVVTAGSVVTKDLPANMICSGNPCVPVKMR